MYFIRNYFRVILTSILLFYCGLSWGIDVNPLIQQLKDKNPTERIKAVQQLRDLGPEAKDALPALIRMAKDKSNQEPSWLPTFQNYIAQAIARIGTDAIPSLITVLDENDVNSKIIAVKALGEMGSSAKEAVPYLINFLQSDDFYLRFWTIDTLGKIGPDAQEAVPHLIKIFQKSDIADQELVSKALANIGTPQANKITRFFRMKERILFILFLPFTLFIVIPGSPFVIPVILLIFYFIIKRRDGKPIKRWTLWIPIIAWVVYGLYETILVLWVMPKVSAPIRIDLVLLMPLLYLSLIIGIVPWLVSWVKKGRETK